MKTQLGIIINRAKEIYRNDGLIPLLKNIFTSLISFEISSFYIYERTLIRGKESDFMPKIQNVTHKIVEIKQQLDELLNGGFDLSLLDITQAQRRLKKGAIASLIFIERELATTHWVALSEESKNTLNAYPYKVNFSNNEACAGGVWTNPKYRGQGLNIYSAYKKDEFLKEKGVTKQRLIVSSTNIAGQGATTKHGSRLLAKARYIKVFGLQFWKETQIESTNND